MIWIVVIVLSAICFGIAIALRNKKQNELIAGDKMVERDGYKYFQQAHFFDTTVSSIEQVGNAIDKGVLQSESISFEPHYDEGYIVFHNNVAFGTFGAALRSCESEGGKYRYRFLVEAWKSRDGGITRQDLFGANIVLTQIEKAFYRLDNSTTVIRKEAMYK